MKYIIKYIWLVIALFCLIVSYLNIGLLIFFFISLLLSFVIWQQEYKNIPHIYDRKNNLLYIGDWHDYMKCSVYYCSNYREYKSIMRNKKIINSIFRNKLWL
jgi:hypothetical protein